MVIVSQVWFVRVVWVENILTSSAAEFGRCRRVTCMCIKWSAWVCHECTLVTLDDLAGGFSGMFRLDFDKFLFLRWRLGWLKIKTMGISRVGGGFVVEIYLGICRNFRCDSVFILNFHLERFLVVELNGFYLIFTSFVICYFCYFFFGFVKNFFVKNPSDNPAKFFVKFAWKKTFVCPILFLHIQQKYSFKMVMRYVWEIQIRFISYRRVKRAGGDQKDQDTDGLGEVFGQHKRQIWNWCEFAVVEIEK